MQEGRRRSLSLPSRRGGVVSFSRPFPQILSISHSCTVALRVICQEDRLIRCNDSCTVVCFKAHKTSGCSSEKEYIPLAVPLPLFQPLDTHTTSPLSPSLPPTDSAAPTPPSPKSRKRSRDEIIRANRPTRKLVDLNWPVEPAESIWDDPLSRDDLKPLRGWEYEAIGSSLIPHHFATNLSDEEVRMISYGSCVASIIGRTEITRTYRKSFAIFS